MKVTKKEGKHGINKFFEYDNGIKCAAYASNNEGYSIRINGEYFCSLSPNELDAVCHGANVVANCGGDVVQYFQQIKDSKTHYDCTTQDGRYTFSISNKKSAGGVIAYGYDNINKIESRLLPIIKCNTIDEIEDAVNKARKICRAACTEYDNTGRFKAYPQCKLEHSYTEEEVKETVQLRFDSTLEDRHAALLEKCDDLLEKYERLYDDFREIQGKYEELKIKTQEQDWSLDMYRYDKWDEDSSCPYCNGKLERLYSNKNDSLFIGCTKCKKFSDSYNEHYKRLYEEGHIKDRWVENNLSKDF